MERLAAPQPMKCLVTGASGFIGAHLVRLLRAAGHEVRAGSRRVQAEGDVRLELAAPDTLAAACAGVDVVFHCAGYAHAQPRPGASFAEEHRLLNFEGACAMAYAARDAGVSRFIFFSSVKAMGEPGEVLVDENWAPPPDTAYGRAKRTAENALWDICHGSAMEAVVLRPAMVYGPGSRGNLEKMGQAIARGWFPAIPETHNHRSMIHVSDVARAALLCATDPRARGRTYILAHPEAPSGREIYVLLCQSLGRAPGSLAMPASAWYAAGIAGSIAERLLRRALPMNREVVARLLRSAWYSPQRIRRELGWRAEVDLEAGLLTLSQP